MRRILAGPFGNKKEEKEEKDKEKEKKQSVKKVFSWFGSEKKEVQPSKQKINKRHTINPTVLKEWKAEQKGESKQETNEYRTKSKTLVGDKDAVVHTKDEIVSTSFPPHSLPVKRKPSTGSTRRSSLSKKSVHVRTFTLLGSGKEAEVLMRYAIHTANVVKAQKFASKFIQYKKTMRYWVFKFMKSKESAQYKRRHRIWHEIIYTEKFLLEKLVFVMQKFKVPLEEAVICGNEIISKPQIRAIFGHVDKVKLFTSMLVKKLEEEVLPGTSGAPVAQIYLQQAPMMLETYTPFVNNFMKALETYEQIKKEPKWSKFEQECEKDPQFAYCTLQDLLIMPIQRIPHLKLLFEQLLKLTPEDHVDYKHIDHACVELGNVCSQINSQQKLESLVSDTGHTVVTIHCPEAQIKYRTSVNLELRVNELASNVVKNLPNNDPDVVVYFGSKKLNDDKKLATYLHDDGLSQEIVLTVKPNKRKKTVVM